MKASKFRLILAILLPLIVGGISALLTRNNMDLYQEIIRPPYAPPSDVFPIAWTILYIMMGAAAYLIMESQEALSICFRAYAWYLLQLFMNFFWSIIFFNMRQFLFAFIWLTAMYAVIIICTWSFFRIDRRAGWLMVPYNIWMAYAAYLNLAIVLMN